MRLLHCCSVVGRDSSITVFGRSDASSVVNGARFVSEHGPCQSMVRVRARSVSEHGPCQTRLGGAGGGGDTCVLCPSEGGAGPRRPGGRFYSSRLPVPLCPFCVRSVSVCVSVCVPGPADGAAPDASRRLQVICIHASEGVSCKAARRRPVRRLLSVRRSVSIPDGRQRTADIL